MSKKIYIISHTHWDREWNQPFQYVRKRLVDMMDELIEHMEQDPEYKYFHLDGQTVVVEDYLEIKPENKERLKKLIQQGRIIIGPWYVMPDEALPSAESLVRNLLKGHEIAREYGVSPMKVGYVIDMFGHTSQFPQILKGFVIDCAVLYRGMGDFMESEFEWEAPDGSRVLGLKRDEDRAYSDFYFAIRWPFYGRAYDKDELIERFRNHVQYIADRATTNKLLMMDGVDNIDIEKQLPWIINILREAENSMEIVHATLEQYIADLRPDLKNLKVFKGELREPGKKGMNNVVLANVLSSRVHLKQYNKYCENLLENWTEPWCVFGDMLGKKYPYGFLKKAWEYLLKNHPHDSIGGCSMTEVHQDMIYRFDQCRWIGECILEDTLKHIVSKVDNYSMAGEGRITLFNPSQEDYEGIVAVEVERKDMSQFKIFDSNGNEVPYQLLSLKGNHGKTIIQKSDIPSFETVNIYKVAFYAKIPAYGYNTFSYVNYALPSNKRGEYTLQNEETPVRYPGSQLVSPNTAENDYLRLSINENGTIDVLDKETSYTYKGLLLFEDEADIGDGWVYRSPVENERVNSYGRQSSISVLRDGPFTTTFRVRISMLLPTEISDDHFSRKQDYKEIEIVTDLTLNKGERRILCNTTVDNSVRDHRLKLLFPTGICSDFYYTSNAFDFIKRPVKKKDYRDYREEAQYVVPNHGVIAVENGIHGIAVFNKGLYEVEVKDDKERTIALTLFRGTRSEVANICHDGGQVLGKRDFEYCLEFYTVEADFPGSILKRYQFFSNGIKSFCGNKQKGTLPVQKRFIKISSNNTIVSAIKRSEENENGYILRLYNPGNCKEIVSVCFEANTNIKKVEKVNLNEELLENLPFRDTSFEIEVGPKKIVSVIVTS